MHVRLRPVTPDDLPLLFEFQLDPEANRMAVANPRSRDDFDTHWAHVLRNPGVTARAIVIDAHSTEHTDAHSDAPSPHTETLVGTISCFPLDGLPSVGYWIARAHWGRGIATRALQLLLEEVTTRPLHARAARDNAASIRVLEHGGFRITGHHHAPATDRFPACEEALLVLDRPTGPESH